MRSDFCHYGHVNRFYLLTYLLTCLAMRLAGNYVSEVTYIFCVKMDAKRNQLDAWQSAV